MTGLQKRITVAVLLGFLIGLVAFTAFRFVTYTSDAVHYHANFALYVNGQRDEFKSFTFYEEVQACTSDADGDPKHRLHLHNQQNDLIHVHAPATTWGHLFANLGYTLGDKVIATDSGVYQDNKKQEVSFILNGKPVSSIANKVVNSEDRLLISYGNESEAELQQRFDTVATTAGEYNGKFDPGGCSGNEQLTVFERLKRSIISK